MSSLQEKPFQHRLEAQEELYPHQDITSMERSKSTSTRKRFIIATLVFLLIAAIVMAIAIPVSLNNRNNTNDLSAERIQSTAIDNNVTTIDTKSTMPQNNTQIRKFASLITPDQQQSFHFPAYAHAVSPYSNLTRLKILRVPEQARVFVMGDIHGSLAEMNQLVEKIHFQPNQDVLILAGDMVAKGKDSVNVIKRARELGAFCVRGNHDDKVVRLKSYEYKHSLDSMQPKDEIMPEGEVGDPLKFGNKHIEISKQLNVDDYNYLAGCPLILDVPDLNARVVHGGLDPNIANLVDNDPWSVMNMRDFDSNNQPSKLKLNKDPTSETRHWTSAYQSHADSVPNSAIVYYGHDASRGIVIGNNTVGVDSGCVYGRKLSVIEMRSRQLTQVDCVKGEEDHKHDDDEEE